MASHSVQSHLRVDASGYDAQIRRFIPRYEEMLDEAVGFICDATASIARPRFVDLGIGTGALSERILQRVQTAQVIGIDVDPKMLEEATRRLRPIASERLQLRLQDFCSALPSGRNGYLAALALHHIAQLDSKQALYRTIYDVLSPGGIFVNADAMFEEPNSNEKRSRWARHLVSSGFTEPEAHGHLQSWRQEDCYFSLEAELDLLRRAGFSRRDVIWRYGPMAVLAGVKT
jgi:tRNA (cmo5U34)-methyltransferase